MEYLKNSNVIAWLKLLRLPNVFTAVADVAMGYLVTHGDLHPAGHFALLVAASCLLYLSGMVLNDVFDAAVDARERPERPIPSGRVSLRSAAAIGWGLLASGTLVGWYVTFLTGNWRPGVVATLLAACVLLYDGVLKRTPIAPVAMGCCRMLNVLLGMSLVPRPWNMAEWLIAPGIGLYIIGVTLFARTDARDSSRGQLVGGLVLLIGGMVLVAAAPKLTDYGPPLHIGVVGWYLLWAALGLIAARRCIVAIVTPTPLNVQAAVRHCVQSIIVLDAAVCVGYAGPMWGFAMFALLAPTLLLAAWLKAT